jgi:glycosyltransferase involved in cell wall biosynthesis
VGNVSWIKLVPPSIREELLADLVAALDALLEDSQKGVAAPIDKTNLAESVEQAVRLHEAFGFHAALHGLLRKLARRERSVGFETFANALTQRDRVAAIRAYWMAYASNPSPAKASKIAQRMFKAGDITSAGSLIQLGEDQAQSAFDAELRLAARLFGNGPVIPKRAVTLDVPEIDVAYVASSSIAHQVVGYTVRTHQILSALNDIGIRTRCVVRPGYPWDRSATVTGAPRASHIIDGVSYSYTKIPDMSEDPEAHVEKMADALVRRFRKIRPSVVHAASNHRNALPALIAARKVGVPFVYEVRGLWELTTASRVVGWEQTERFALERSLELEIATKADQVLTITEGVAAELVAGGVKRNRVGILPNGVNPNQFQPMGPDELLAKAYNLHEADIVLVYCGSLVIYEGLDDLIEAVSILRSRNIRARLLVVGAGNYRDRLRELVAAHQLGSHVAFVDPVPAGEVHRYWSLADVVALPRKPFKVCEVVSPLKPFEAMAMGKPVVLTDLAVSREIVQDGVTGFLCQPANPGDLAAVLERLARDHTLRRTVGKQAREWVTIHRSWRRNAERLWSVYSHLTGRKGIGSEALRGGRT